jgi:hypothetical protein
MASRQDVPHYDLARRNKFGCYHNTCMHGGLVFSCNQHNYTRLRTTCSRVVTCCARLTHKSNGSRSLPALPCPDGTRVAGCVPLFVVGAMQRTAYKTQLPWTLASSGRSARGPCPLQARSIMCSMPVLFVR